MRKIITISCIILLSSAFDTSTGLVSTLSFCRMVDCRAEGLGTLIELGKSQAEMQKQYAQETKTFEIVKKAIAAGAIKQGQDKASIRAKYGEPVVIVDDPDGKREDWIYKPAESSFFKGIRATLFFTAEGLLDEAKLEER